MNQNYPVGEILRQIRAAKPLIHCITNYVTVNDCANALLAAGARPVMSHAPQEAAEVTRGADALVLNLGGTEFMDAMFLSAAAAAGKNIPVVIDPVGIGGSSYRREMLRKLTGICRPAAIRGNRAEMQTLLFGDGGETGVDYTGGIDGLKELAAAAESYAASHACTVFISGAADVVTDGRKTKLVEGGDAMMSRVTGTGCMGSALLGAFLAAGRNLGIPDAEACMACSEFVDLAAERAAEQTRTAGGGTGTFRIRLIDALDLIAGESV